MGEIRQGEMEEFGEGAECTTFCPQQRGEFSHKTFPYGGAPSSGVKRCLTLWIKVSSLWWWCSFSGVKRCLTLWAKVSLFFLKLLFLEMVLPGLEVGEEDVDSGK